MKEIRFFYAPDASSNDKLPEEEARHALRVLRLRPGDDIYLTDGKDHLFSAKITEAKGSECSFEIIDSQTIPPTWNGTLHLAVAPTKNMDRTEWFAEKATEVGFDKLTFLDCAFSERRKVKTERVEKILLSAVKQSHKLRLPSLADMTKFADFIRLPFPGRKYIAHCYEEPELNPRGKPFLPDALSDNQDSCVVMIGPEGDFSTEEVKAAIKEGFIPISLGESRLRSETAALAAVLMMNINNRKKRLCN